MPKKRPQNAQDALYGAFGHGRGIETQANRWAEIVLFTDQRLRTLHLLMEAVVKEDKRQREKWGVQSRTAFEWYTYLGEEVGEVAKAISEFLYRRGSREEVFKEAIQTATLALKIAEMFKE